jgi:hypothetical protein
MPSPSTPPRLHSVDERSMDLMASESIGSCFSRLPVPSASPGARFVTRDTADRLEARLLARPLGRPFASLLLSIRCIAALRMSVC